MQTISAYMALEEGDAVPNFSQRGASGIFNLSNLGGSFVALALFPSSALGAGKAVLEITTRYKALFDGEKAVLIAAVVDHQDEARLKDAPGFTVLFDFDGKVARRYGATPMEVPPGTRNIQYRPRFITLDKRMRVLVNLELRPDGGDAGCIVPEIENLARLAVAEPELSPPVLIVPRVFQPEICRQLIALFDAHGGEETGVITQAGEATSVVLNRDFKRRRDLWIEDAPLIGRLKALLKRHLLPEIAKAFQFEVTHVERHIVSRYTAEERGLFRAHRDNNSKGAAYRRFAATINLNNDFEGGELSFPEFGPRSFKAPEGGAIVFSCSLLHQVSEMTRGRRYAYLPFFYDDAAAKILEANRASWTAPGDAPADATATRI
jgi:predicted 2-oxoglutarate/Fe(II)-dependent dioxygenase YbiX